MTIKYKLLIAFLLIGLLSVVTVGTLGFFISKKHLTQSSFNSLTAIRETKKRQIESYFKLIENQVLTLVQDHAIINAMQEFKAGFEVYTDEVGKPTEEEREKLRNYYEHDFLPNIRKNIDYQSVPEEYLKISDTSYKMQFHYLAENQYPVGQKDLLHSASEKSSYNIAHSKYHNYLRNYLERFGYYDIFLIDHNSGDIVYSAFKEVDFGTNLFYGPYRKTSFARLFHIASKAKIKGKAIIMDFEFYPPSYMEPASFIAAPIYSDKGEKVGILIAQIGMSRINQVMTGNFSWKQEGLGDSGETYLVGDDFLMRNDSRFLFEDMEGYLSMLSKKGTSNAVINKIRNMETSVLLQPIMSYSSKNALAGESGTEIVTDYRGVKVLSSYAPLNIRGMKWAILSEIDEAEAFKAIKTTRSVTILSALIISVFIGIFGYLFSRRISVPLMRLKKATQMLQGGKLNEDIPVQTNDEVGELTHCFNEMRKSIQSAESALRESEQRIRAIVDTALDAIVTIDENGIIEFFNPAAARIFGWEIDEAIGRNVSILMPSPNREKHDDYMKRLKETGERRLIGTNREMEGEKKDGTVFPISISLAEVCFGEYCHYTALIRDITSDKEHIAEMQSAQKQILESEKMASLGGLVAGVAHEVNTPVGIGVTAASHLDEVAKNFQKLYAEGTMKRSDLEDMLSTVERYTETILSNLLRAADLVKGFKQVAVDQTSEAIREFNLKQYIEEVIKSLKPKYKRTGHKMVIDGPDDILLESYPGALSQIVTNLITNSLIHGFEDMENGEMHFTLASDGVNASIIYCDNGKGIPEENIKKIFDPFFTTKRGSGGSGLGLNILYNLATQKLRGKVDCTSKAGDGVKFKIDIPLKVED